MPQAAMWATRRCSWTGSTSTTTRPPVRGDTHKLVYLFVAHTLDCRHDACLFCALTCVQRTNTFPGPCWWTWNQEPWTVFAPGPLGSSSGQTTSSLVSTKVTGHKRCQEPSDSQLVEYQEPLFFSSSSKLPPKVIPQKQRRLPTFYHVELICVSCKINDNYINMYIYLSIYINIHLSIRIYIYIYV